MESTLPSADAAEVDVTPRRVALIPPGTVIADRAPKGWTNLVINSHPRVGPESLDKVSRSTARLSSLLVTAVLADVRSAGQAPGGAPFVLNNVAVGVGTRVNGQDIILTSETQAQLGANLGFLEGQVLSGGEKKLLEMRCVARSRTMAIVDGPSVAVRGTKHRHVVLRYALMVDPNTGRLETLLWLLDRDDQGEYTGPVGPLQLLAPDKLEDCVLHVDPREFILGVPTSLAFAMARMPQGRVAIECPHDLKPAAAQSQFTVASARALEQGLRNLLPRTPQ